MQTLLWYGLYTINCFLNLFKFNQFISIMTLEERLKYEVDSNKWKNENIENVRQLIRGSYENERIPYRFLKEFEDFQLYYELHPEWKGISVTEMKRSDDYLTRTFAVAYYLWVKKQTSDKGERISLMKKLFVSKRGNWSSFKTVDDWRREYDSYGWTGRSVRKVMNESNEGNNFCRAFYVWVNNQTPVHKKRQLLRAKLFARKLNDWTDFRTLDNWINEYYKHPKWKGKTCSEMQKEFKSGGCAFYQSFYKWARKQSYPKLCRKVLLIIISGEKIKRNMDDLLAYCYDNHRNESKDELMESNPYLFLRLYNEGLLEAI